MVEFYEQRSVSKLWNSSLIVLTIRRSQMITPTDLLILT